MKTFRDILNESSFDSIPKCGSEYCFIPKDVENPLKWKAPSGKKYVSPFSDDQFLLTPSGTWIRVSNHYYAIYEMYMRSQNKKTDDNFLGFIQKNIDIKVPKWGKFIKDSTEFARQLGLIKVNIADNSILVEKWHGCEPTASQLEEIRYVAALNDLNLGSKIGIEYFLSREELLENYSSPHGLSMLPAHLKRCPVHRWRAKTGIELVHKEPNREEQERIWKNWNLMTPEKKRKSEERSKKLFGKTNRDHNEEIMKQWKRHKLEVQD